MKLIWNLKKNCCYRHHIEEYKTHFQNCNINKLWTLLMFLWDFVKFGYISQNNCDHKIGYKDKKKVQKPKLVSQDQKWCHIWRILFSGGRGNQKQKISKKILKCPKTKKKIPKPNWTFCLTYNKHETSSRSCGGRILN